MGQVHTAEAILASGSGEESSLCHHSFVDERERDRASLSHTQKLVCIELVGAWYNYMLCTLVISPTASNQYMYIMVDKIKVLSFISK